MYICMYVCTCMYALTEECSKEEWPHWDSDDRRGNVDEPVRQEGSDPQEDDVVQDIFIVSCNLEWNILIYMSLHTANGVNIQIRQILIS